MEGASGVHTRHDEYIERMFGIQGASDTGLSATLLLQAQRWKNARHDPADGEREGDAQHEDR